MINDVTIDKIMMILFAIALLGGYLHYRSKHSSILHTTINASQDKNQASPCSRTLSLHLHRNESGDEAREGHGKTEEHPVLRGRTDGDGLPRKVDGR